MNLGKAICGKRSHGLKGSVDITQIRLLGYWILPITCTKAISVEPYKAHVSQPTLMPKYCHVS